MTSSEGGFLCFWKDTIIKKGQSVCDFAATLSHVNALVKHHQRFVQAENIDNYLGNVVLEITQSLSHSGTLKRATLFSHTNGCPHNPLLVH